MAANNSTITEQKNIKTKDVS